MSKLQIEIWSDVICPWCWIGKARLAEALARFEQADAVEITHRAYMLMPNQQIEPIAAVMARNYGASPERVKEMHASVAQAAAESGLDFKGEEGLAGDTRDAHRLIAYAGARGQEMLSRLYTAYFTEGRSVHHPESLAEIAAEIGFDRAAVLQMLAGEDFMNEVVHDIEEAQAFQVRGVPFFVMGRKLAVPGALPAEDMLGALRQAWQLSDFSIQTDGTVCTPDGC